MSRKEHVHGWIKVCIVAPSTRLVGGQSASADRLVKRLREVPDIEVKFVPTDAFLPGPLQWVRRVKGLRTLVNFPFYVCTLLRAARYSEIFHIFSASYSSFLISTLPAVIVARLFRKKHLINYRSGECRDHLSKSILARKVCALSDSIVVPSQYLVEVFAEHEISATAIPNFIELAELPYRIRKPLRPVFLSNRNHEELYNVACAIRAFRIVQTRISEARLVVVGSGSHTDGLKELSLKLNLENVTFCGSVVREKMAQIYDECDILLNTPNIDNMPSTLLEAAACGLLIVSTDVGGIPYIVEDGKTALLVNPDDPDAVALASLTVLSEQRLATRLIDHARQEVKENYDWFAVRKQWLQLYEALL